MPKLPETTAVKMEKDQTAECRIEWQNLTEALFEQPGAKKVEGRIAGTNGLKISVIVIADFERAIQMENTKRVITPYQISEDFSYVSSADTKVKFNDITEIDRDGSLLYGWSENLLIENCTMHDYGFQYGVYPSPNNENPEYLIIRAPYIRGFSIRGTAYDDTKAEKNFSFETSADAKTWQPLTGYEKTTDNTSENGWPSRRYQADNLPEDTNYIRILFPANETWEFNLNQIEITGGIPKEEAPAEPIEIRLDADGGTLPDGAADIIFIEEGGAVAELPIPIRENYNFKGWFTAKEGGVEVKAGFTPAESITIYARWEAEEQPSVTKPEPDPIKSGVVPSPDTMDQSGVTDQPGITKDPEMAVEAGKTFTAGGFCYRITKINGTKGNVTLEKILKKKSKVTIPATVKKDKITFQVTAIGKKAFFKDKKLTNIVIGKNVTNIGVQSFFQCSKLKSITYKSTKLPKIGSKAFLKIKKNCKVFVPKKMSSKNLKRLKNGMKSAGKKIVYKKKN